MTNRMLALAPAALLAVCLAPTVALLALGVALGVAGATTAAVVVLAPTPLVWAIGLGRALYLDANRAELALAPERLAARVRAAALAGAQIAA